MKVTKIKLGKTVENIKQLVTPNCKNEKVKLGKIFEF
jgi:hypothetical protein